MSDLQFMLAKEYTKDMKVPRKVNPGWKPPVGWLLSEKYDGYRARWMPDDDHFLSRSNKVYTGTPDWFLSSMPNKSGSISILISIIYYR